MIRSHSGKIIRISDAYTDPISQPYYDALPYSQKRLDAIAKSQGYSGKLTSTYGESTNIKQLYERTKQPD